MHHNGGDGSRDFLRRRRRRGNLRRDRVAFLRAGRRGRGAASAVSRGRPRGRRGPAAHVPRAVLGRPANVFRAAGASPAADAPHAVPDHPDRTRRLAAVHAHRRRLDRLAHPRRRAPAAAARLPRDGRTLAREFAAVTPGSQPDHEAWWSDAVFYQVYPRSFADSDGDGVGDLDGLAARLDYLGQLGVDAIWINPVTVSPMADHGYDVADPRDIDPLFGGLAAFERLVEAAHARRIRVTMDVVPNHTSSQHAWFQAALAAGPGTGARDRYFFRDGRGPDGS